MQNFQSKLVEKKQLTENVFEFYFDFIDQVIPFLPGQFFMMQIPGTEKTNRSYSIASAPNEKGFVLCVKLMESGLGSDYLRQMQIGDIVDFMGPAGHFTLQDSSKEIIMVATGTGLAPFMGMLPVLFEKKAEQPITLYFGCRDEEDLFYTEQLEKWEEEYDNFTFTTCLSQGSKKWKGALGRVTDLLENHPIDPLDTKVYICGNGEMVKDVRAMMIEAGLTKTDIHLELFTPIK